jgi:hypothetical protein
MVVATFANQVSNLSALGAAMGSFDRVLNVSDDTHSETDLEEHSATFLHSQRERIADIEEDLLLATGFILPDSSSASTVTELAELCRLVQDGSRKKMEILQQRLQAMGVTSLNSEEAVSTVAPSPSSDVFWSIGGPLASVVEGDVETEGATTPGSMLHPSPFSSHQKPWISPATPKMDAISLRYVFRSHELTLSDLNWILLTFLCFMFVVLFWFFSASTTSLLQNITPNGSKRMSPSPYRRNSRPSGSFRQVNFDGFQEDDDMITVDQSMLATTPAAKRRLSGTAASEPMKQTEFISKMESMLDKVDESILESRPSDEVTLQTRKNNTTELHEDEEDDDEYSSEDDSTDDVATQVASITRRRRMSMSEQDGGDKLRQFRSASTTSKQIQSATRPTHILVDTEAPSPAHTNITMDATMLDDTMISVSLFQDDDNNSTVTPILDRYRLDPDDNSVGIKVVPNKRGGSSRFQKPLIIETVPEQQTLFSSSSSFYTQEDGFTSPRGLPGTVSARKKKEYRKTPLPKKLLHADDSMDTWDENDDPNIQFTVSSSSKKLSSSPQRKSSSTMGSFTVPPLRPMSYEPKRQEKTPFSSSSSTTRPTSLPLTKSTSRTPLSDDFMKQAFPADVDEDTAGSKLNLSDRFERESVRLTKWMEHITMAEYDIAPRIVQVQVRRDEANEVIDLLEEFLTSNLQLDPSSSLEFGEQQGYEILGKSFETNKKCKSVLMSLCHFRRLLMYREDEMRFVVNQFSA